jgi:3-keto-disaccharide hydrolase
MKGLLLIVPTLLASPLLAADSEAGFKTIFDGKTFAGWKTADEHPGTWTIQDAALVAHGERCHLFYVGEEKPFKDFELKVEVMTEPGSNGGIYFHTRYQEVGWPKYGFESQVNVSHSDWIKTGSLYGVANVGLTPAEDNKWWTQHIIVQGNRVTVKIDGRTVLEYNEPPGARAGADFTRKIDGGTFALQAHDPKSIVRYRNIRVKRLE